MSETKMVGKYFQKESGKPTSQVEFRDAKRIKIGTYKRQSIINFFKTLPAAANNATTLRKCIVHAMLNW